MAGTLTELIYNMRANDNLNSITSANADAESIEKEINNLIDRNISAQKTNNPALRKQSMREMKTMRFAINTRNVEGISNSERQHYLGVIDRAMTVSRKQNLKIADNVNGVKSLLTSYIPSFDSIMGALSVSNPLFGIGYSMTRAIGKQMTNRKHLKDEKINELQSLKIDNTPDVEEQRNTENGVVDNSNVLDNIYNVNLEQLRTMNSVKSSNSMLDDIHDVSKKHLHTAKTNSVAPQTANEAAYDNSITKLNRDDSVTNNNVIQFPNQVVNNDSVVNQNTTTNDRFSSKGLIKVNEGILDATNESDDTLTKIHKTVSDQLDIDKKLLKLDESTGVDRLEKIEDSREQARHNKLTRKNSKSSDIGDEMSDMLKGNLIDEIKDSIPLFGTLFGAFGALGGMVGKIVPFITMALTKIPLIAGVVGGIYALSDAFKKASDDNYVKKMLDKTNIDILDRISVGVGSVVGKIGSILDFGFSVIGIETKIGDFMEKKTSKFLSEFSHDMSGKISTMYDNASEFVMGEFDKFADMSTLDIAKNIINFPSSIVSRLFSVAEDAARYIVGDDAVDGMKKIVIEKRNELYEVIENLFDSIFDILKKYLYEESGIERIVNYDKHREIQIRDENTDLSVDVLKDMAKNPNISNDALIKKSSAMSKDIMKQIDEERDKFFSDQSKLDALYKINSEIIKFEIATRKKIDKNRIVENKNKIVRPENSLDESRVGVTPTKKNKIIEITETIEKRNKEEKEQQAAMNIANIAPVANTTNNNSTIIVGAGSSRNNEETFSKSMAVSGL